MKKLLRGDSELSVILGLGVATVFAVLLSGLFYTPDKTTNAPTSVNVELQPCVIPPNSGTPLSFNGKNYRLIRKAVPFLKIELSLHLEKSGQNITIEGKTRELYFVDDRIYLSGWTDDAFKMVFVDVSQDVSPEQNSPVYIFFDVYYEENNPIPGFIQEHCNLNSQLGPRPLTRDEAGNINPPTSLNSAAITSWQNGSGDGCYIVTQNGVPIGDRCEIKPPANTKYSLLAYDYKTTGTGEYNLSNKFPRGKYTFTYKGKQKTYSAHYVSESIMPQLILFDDAPEPGEEGVIYKYVSPAYPVPDPKSFQINEETTGASGKNTLQIGTFTPIAPGVEPWGWWTPECKPAVYLYPEIKQPVHVLVKPVGPMTYTSPSYPTSGWSVIAHPSGQIWGGDKYYDYLYYEAKLPDQKVSRPTKGYVFPASTLSQDLAKILTEVGLNEKEKNDFLEYWNPILPSSPYYLVGLVSEETLAELSPLSVFPSPTSLLRVMFYFEPINTPIAIEKPEIHTFKREGFTVVEWGGIYKQDKTHPFTCLM